MSRAYRIRVRESLRRVLRAHDQVSTELEMLEILPAGQMAQLLEQELRQRGFERRGQALVRRQGGVTVEVDPASATVTVRAEAEEKFKSEQERDARTYEEAGRQAEKLKESMRASLKQELEKAAQERQAGLQAEVTDRLEGQLRDLRVELDQTVNRVTAEALKQKAAQMGQIKEITEDPQAGSMTIVLEV
jgi:hypothetical protein